MPVKPAKEPISSFYCISLIQFRCIRPVIDLLGYDPYQKPVPPGQALSGSAPQSLQLVGLRSLCVLGWAKRPSE
jgi:hypothetical protein